MTTGDDGKLLVEIQKLVEVIETELTDQELQTELIETELTDDTLNELIIDDNPPKLDDGTLEGTSNVGIITCVETEGIHTIVVTVLGTKVHEITTGEVGNELIYIDETTRVDG